MRSRRETDNDNDNDDVNVVIIRSDLNSFVRNKEFAAYNLLVSIIGLSSNSIQPKRDNPEGSALLLVDQRLQRLRYTDTHGIVKGAE